VIAVAKLSSTKRFQLSTPADGIGFVSEFIQAERLAIEKADELMESVRIFDHYAHTGQIDLWIIRAGESFIRPVRVKQRKVA